MDDYIKREDAIKAVIADAKLKNLLTGNCENEKAIEGMVYEVLCPRDVPSACVVSQSDFNRIKEERDYVIKQLQEHGIWIMRDDRIIHAADVVEVVRCKDCKHRKKNTFCLHNMRYEDDNGFCSYGERADA